VSSGGDQPTFGPSDVVTGGDTGLMHLRLRPSAVSRRRFGADSIRELVFGIEDGVVQNVTLIAGMVGASLPNQIIVIAAAINAIAGVLSMSMGTYLSSKAERDVALATSDESAAVGHRINCDSPLRDALIMAGAYTVGAVVPLLPFRFRDRKPCHVDGGCGDTDCADSIRPRCRQGDRQ
jgi:VIT1/CCC1 family predicted Fe2+/Mn2+ transporter